MIVKNIDEFNIYIEELIKIIHKLKLDILFYEITGAIRK